MNVLRRCLDGTHLRVVVQPTLALSHPHVSCIFLPMLDSRCGFDSRPICELSIVATGKTLPYSLVTAHEISRERPRNGSEETSPRVAVAILVLVFFRVRGQIAVPAPQSIDQFCKEQVIHEVFEPMPYSCPCQSGRSGLRWCNCYETNQRWICKFTGKLCSLRNLRLFQRRGFHGCIR
jgi:hypothetical protein